MSLFSADLDAIENLGWIVDCWKDDYLYSAGAKELFGHPGIRFSIRARPDCCCCRVAPRLAYRWFVKVRRAVSAYASYSTQYAVELYDEESTTRFARSVGAGRAPPFGRRGERHWDEGDWTLHQDPNTGEWFSSYPIQPKTVFNRHWRFVDPLSSVPEKYEFDWYNFRFDWTLSQGDAAKFALAHSEIVTWAELPAELSNRAI